MRDPVTQAGAAGEETPDARDTGAAVSAARARPRKAPGAFRTISEVADELHIPQHVLRFWETKFAHVRPLKRGGGRRYYRPDDVALLRRIADLLYIQGYTIKGVQRLLREGNGRLADQVSPPAPEDADNAAEAGTAQPPPPELPLPGLTLVPLAGRPRRRTGSAPVGSAIASDEAAWLRAVLMETLAELRAIRALLP